MLSPFWTALLVLLLGALAVAWLVALMHEKNIRPFKSLWKHVRRMSFVGLCALALWGVPFIQYGSTKNGVTNGVQNVANMGLLPMPNANVQLATDNNLTRTTLIASTNTTRTITGDDFRRGFVVTRVGTGEAFDFSAPSNAVVCADWRAFGAATDWIYVALTNWAFRVATNDVDRLRIHSAGWVEMRPWVATAPSPSPAEYDGEGAVATQFWPLKTILGIVPEANWHLLATNSPSQFWHYVTPSNTLQITWQNALLDRDTDTPVSFQAEFWTDGRFTYRYDLSRCGGVGYAALPDGVLTNVVVGASFASNAWTTNTIPTNITSMTFYPLSAEDVINPDPDNDGLATIDELFVYHTDPRHPDSDYDGLTDYEELFVYHTNPLDPYSSGGPHCDGLAVRLGDLDPFAYPEGSTNTVLEHVFYSGTTNGAFAYPQSDTDTAILRVTVSGTGAGRLVVGDSVVPLVAPPQMRGGVPGNAFTLLLPVVKGETHPAYVYGDESLAVTLDSDDFAFGALPTLNAFGHVNFPNTQATPACIHDFNSGSRFVSLPTGKDAELLAATWTGGEGVSVSNVPPRATVINANFYAGSIKEVSYSLSHPQYLFGQTQYSQPVRFCPRPKKTPSGTSSPDDPQDEYSDTPDPDDPTWFSSGEDVSSTGNDGQDGEDNAVGDNEDFDDSCPDHYGPYEECDYAHESEYSNSVLNVTHLNGVLYIREPPLYEPIYLDVPTEHTNCCPCPEHWENYVGVAYKSYRVNLVDSNGLPFDRTETSCYVNVAGAYPSSAVGDAEIAFTRNGDIYQYQHRTVLGVAIKGHQFDLAPYNALNPDFGYPMTVCTNLWYAPQMRLVTNVKLPGGHVRLELANASGQFTVWYPDTHGGTYRKLLDTSSTRVKNLTMAYWKALMRRATNGNTAELPIYITSSAPGTVTLKFRYWNVIDDKLVEDEAVQCITSVRPPLRLDITRDGSIDDGDAAAWLDRRNFYYWVNESKIDGDYIVPEREYTVRNTSDFVVNGTFDLVNLFPVALDFSSFTNAWKNNVTYTVKPKWGDFDAFNFCFADVPWSRAGSIQTTNITTTAGQTLASSSLTALPANGYALPYSFITSFSEDSGLMVCEAKSGYDSLLVEIKYGDTLLYSYSVPMMILPVKEMYSWINSRRLSGDSVVRPTSVHRIWEEQNTKSLIFLHGANVNESQAEAWGDILFKRMWLAGVHADFYNVDWRSNIGGPANYQENASNAFVVASQLATTLSNIPGEKVIMAHSLGNMVVSSMIQDHGLQVSKYLMCNSAVPAEAYDTTLSPTNVLVHKDWNEYPRKSFANEWYKLFEDDVGDDRQLLTWGGRFSSVASLAVNFYSTGDHVLELEQNNNVWAIDGYENWNQKFEHYSWHKQEIWKGRAGILFNMGTTDWAGWSIRENMLGYNTIQPTNAWLMSGAELKTNTVFKLQPECMKTNSIPLLVRGALLAKGISSRTPASGATKWGPLSMNDSMYNLNSTNTTQNGISRPNGWMSRPNGLLGNWGDRWLHSDMKDMAYFYVFKFFEKIKEEGELE